MKILNSLQGKYQNDAQKREFEAMNEEALKEADKRVKEKAEKSLGDYNNRPKYGGMVYGSSAKQWDRPYDVDRRPRPDSSFHITGRFFTSAILWVLKLSPRMISVDSKAFFIINILTIYLLFLSGAI